MKWESWTSRWSSVELHGKVVDDRLPSNVEACSPLPSTVDILFTCSGLMLLPQITTTILLREHTQWGFVHTSVSPSRFSSTETPGVVIGKKILMNLKKDIPWNKLFLFLGITCYRCRVVGELFHHQHKESHMETHLSWITPKQMRSSTQQEHSFPRLFIGDVSVWPASVQFPPFTLYKSWVCVLRSTAPQRWVESTARHYSSSSHIPVSVGGGSEIRMGEGGEGAACGGVTSHMSARCSTTRTPSPRQQHWL